MRTKIMKTESRIKLALYFSLPHELELYEVYTDALKNHSTLNQLGFFLHNHIMNHKTSPESIKLLTDIETILKSREG